MPLSGGDKIGPFEVLAPIGAGGMGEVYRARDGKLNRAVAIKVLPAAFAEDASRMARFEREAQLLAALNHPNIAAIRNREGRDRDGVGGGRGSRGTAAPGHSARVRTADRGGAGGGTREGHHPSGFEAGEHQD